MYKKTDKITNFLKSFPQSKKIDTLYIVYVHNFYIYLVLTSSKKRRIYLEGAPTKGAHTRLRNGI